MGNFDPFHLSRRLKLSAVLVLNYLTPWLQALLVNVIVYVLYFGFQAINVV